MRRWLATSLALGIAAAPSVARAECRNGPECINLGLGKLDPGILKDAAAIGFGVAALGATVAAVKAGTEKPMPDGVVTTTDANGKRHLTLVLIPTPAEVAVEDAPHLVTDKDRRDAGIVRFNETAANIAIAVGGAAILGSIIAGLAKK